MDLKLALACDGESCQLCKIIDEEVPKLEEGFSDSDTNSSQESEQEPCSEPGDLSDSLGGDMTKEFEDAMLASSSAAHMRALKSMPLNGSSTMHTPDCPQPGFYGFAVVPTPERVNKPVTKPKA